MSVLLRLIVLVAALALLPGCRRSEARVYLAPKDPGEAPPVANLPTVARPKISYQAPAGWTETAPGAVSLANFQVKTEAGQATVNVTPLANFAGKEEVVVNMWRDQVGAPKLPPEEVAGSLTAVKVGAEAGQLFEVSGSQNGRATRIVTVMVHRPASTLFYKLAGDDAVVTAQKGAFLEFLKTVQIEDAH